jgi:hypothetical protein
MTLAPQTLRFLWWNLQSFAHYDPSRAGERQWPSSIEAYHAKAQRVDDALRDLCGSVFPEVLAFSEITNQAAQDLRQRLFPTHGLFSLDLLPRAQLQVAFLYQPTDLFQEQGPIVVPNTPRGTRPMGAIDFVHAGHRIRFIGCHWQARFREESKHTRSDVAHFLNTQIYQFLHDERTAPEVRHVVILGDLNEEPYGSIVEERLHAARFRAHSRRPPHYTDADSSRIRLYNCCWRFLGEREPHRGRVADSETAGTYFWASERSWHTFDHVIVTGSLLTDRRPFLDEGSLAIAARPTIMGNGDRPMRFAWNDGRPEGLSDHLPIQGQIALPTEDHLCPQ